MTAKKEARRPDMANDPDALPPTTGQKSQPVIGACGHRFSQPVQYCPYCGQEQLGDGQQSTSQKSASSSTVAHDPAAKPDDKPEPEFKRGSSDKGREPATEALNQPHQSDWPIIQSDVPKRRTGRAFQFGLAAVALAIVMVIAGRLITSAPDNAPPAPDIRLGPPVQSSPPATAPSVTEPPANSANLPSSTVEQQFEKPGFCSHAKYADEQEICQSRPLSMIELGMEKAYSALRDRQPDGHIPAQVRSYARAMLTKRHYCGGEPGCIDAILLAEKAYFASYAN